MATTQKRRRDPERTMALKDHLRELRNRLIKAALGILAGAVAGFFLYDWLVQVLAEPILGYEEDGRLADIAFSTVGGPLDLMIRLSLFVGFVVSSPIWLYQIWAFIMPGLRKTEKRYAIGFIGASVPLFLAGIAAAYSVLPQAIDFFLALNPEGTSNIIDPDVYFTFVLHLFLAFGLAMIIPVVLVGVNMMGLVSGKQVLKAWRGVVMLIAVVSALAAPGGDAVTMFFLAIPLAVLFGIAILLCLLNDKRRAKREAQTDAEMEELIRD
ncbi:twin-arginine translocase subunit TatC [Nesterenkonia halotolerans]|uniref:Sec-independent protein translocase protein TatC n=1 Tax=Nesterenkonia halotolerans TaxID=225325 RepID=A0ABR9J491_9MICC|nr:twin-arginine translocase subunit TatC [Nesterenkonia halotolerans]MBE1513811.1 sec-independent protein translocase protein TatC [Nesterenkonia halotolerans]